MEIQHNPQNTNTTAVGEVNFEDAMSNLFKSSVSGSGEEELLRIASQYSLQISAKQIHRLIYMYWRALRYDYMAEQCLLKAQTDLENVIQLSDEAEEYRQQARELKYICAKWLELKQNNNSAMFVMKALDFISLRRFLNESSFKVDIQK